MKLTLICLHTTRHSDTRSILTAFSRECGIVALGIPAGSGREAARLRALTMPLAMITCETSAPRPGSDILSMKQPAPHRLTIELHSHPVKQMTAMFIAETAGQMLRYGGDDKVLFDFIEATALRLDAATERALNNFPLCFLAHLTEVIGIEPDTSTYKKGRLFDLRDGLWRDTPPMHRDYLSPEESSAAAMLTRITFDNCDAFNFTLQERRRALDLMLHYFSIHSAPLGALRSVGVLRSLV